MFFFSGSQCSPRLRKREELLIILSTLATILFVFIPSVDFWLHFVLWMLSRSVFNIKHCENRENAMPSLVLLVLNETRNFNSAVVLIMDSVKNKSNSLFESSVF